MKLLESFCKTHTWGKVDIYCDGRFVLFLFFVSIYLLLSYMHQKTGYVSKSRAVHLRKEEHICLPFLWYLVMAKYFTRQKTEHPKHGYLIRRDVNIICLSLVSTTCFWHKTNFCNVTEKTKSRAFYSHHCLWIIYYGDNKANKIISVYLDRSYSSPTFEQVKPGTLALVRKWKIGNDF